MQIPNVGSKIRIKVRDTFGPRMIPPRADHRFYEGTVVDKYKWLDPSYFCMTGDANWPVRSIKADNVLDIEYLEGSGTVLRNDVKVWTVKGSKGNEYTVTKSGSKYHCTCPGFTFRHSCKHTAETVC